MHLWFTNLQVAKKCAAGKAIHKLIGEIPAANQTMHFTVEAGLPTKSITDTVCHKHWHQAMDLGEMSLQPRG